MISQKLLDSWKPQEFRIAEEELVECAARQGMLARKETHRINGKDHVGYVVSENLNWRKWSEGFWTASPEGCYHFSISFRPRRYIPSWSFSLHGVAEGYHPHGVVGMAGHGSEFERLLTPAVAKLQPRLWAPMIVIPDHLVDAAFNIFHGGDSFKAREFKEIIPLEQEFVLDRPGRPGRGLQGARMTPEEAGVVYGILKQGVERLGTLLK